MSTLRKGTRLVIDPEDPFAGDCLDRLTSAENLTSLIETVRQPFVLSVNGGWGTGKTTFVEMWAAMLRGRGFPCVSFNAWENDFIDDPLIALISQIDGDIERGTIHLGKRSAAANHWSKAKRLGAGVIRSLAPVALKVATHGVLDAKAIEAAVGEVGDDVPNDLAGYVEAVAKERIASYARERNSIRSFRSSLAKFATGLSREKGHESKPLVFIIDELDRCRPVFAVQLLERVKHLFDAPGVVFVLAIDRQQLAHAVRALYGAEFDATGYLRRFIDLEYQLPRPNSEQFAGVLASQFDLASYFERRGAGDSPLRTLLAVFAACAQMFGLSLRTQEQCFTQLNVFLRTRKDDQGTLGYLVPLLVTLKAANPDLYHKYLEGENGAAEVLDFIAHSPGGRAFLETNHGLMVEAYVSVNSLRKGEPEEIKSKLLDIIRSTGPVEKLQGARLQLDQQQHIRNVNEAGVLPYLRGQLEMSSRFSRTVD